MADKNPEEQPLRVTYNINFWFFQSLKWLAYSLVTAIYVPWALAMHVLLGLLAIPLLPLFCWDTGRNIFLYTYVVTVMIPGKFIWFNFLRHNRRRGKIWDFEVGKPRPVPLQSRRRLSTSVAMASQTASPFLTKLPPEVRQQIYHHVFVGNSSHLHIVQHKTEKSPIGVPKIKIASYPCSLVHDEHDLGDIGCDHPSYRPAIQSRTKTLDSYTLSNYRKLAILQSCRQIYHESINLLYSKTASSTYTLSYTIPADCSALAAAPTFCFNTLAQSPFFPRTILSHRLAQIRSIHLLYVQTTMTKLEHAGCSTAKYYHKVQQCAACNLIHWLEAVKETMPGLKNIEVFLLLDRKSEVPNMGKPWLTRIFDLQHGPNGLRNLKIEISPRGNFLNLVPDLEYQKKITKLDQQLQEKLKRGANQPRIATISSQSMMKPHSRTKALVEAHVDQNSMITT